MADLDDFFAKKDRKKSKSIKKFATADELAKKMEDPKVKPDVVRPKKERPVQEGEEGGRGREEEEWKDYEEPVKDYTGLKILHSGIQGGAPTPGVNTVDSTSEDPAIDASKIKGPWNKPTEPEVAAPAPIIEQPEPPAPKSSAYVPPSNRNRIVEPVRRNQSKHAPDIHNDTYFPVLGASGKRGGGWSVAGGGGGATAGAAGGRPVRQTLSLGNRFTSLPDDS